jgi:hypothetical protein
MQTEEILKEEELSPRLKELQEKIQDESYINNAVDRIAVLVSKRIIDLQEFMSRNSIL